MVDLTLITDREQLLEEGMKLLEGTIKWTVMKFKAKKSLSLRKGRTVQQYIVLCDTIPLVHDQGIKSLGRWYCQFDPMGSLADPSA